MKWARAVVSLNVTVVWADLDITFFSNPLRFMFKEVPDADLITQVWATQTSLTCPMLVSTHSPHAPSFCPHLPCPVLMSTPHAPHALVHTSCAPSFCPHCMFFVQVERWDDRAYFSGPVCERTPHSELPSNCDRLEPNGGLWSFRPTAGGRALLAVWEAHMFSGGSHSTSVA